MTMQNEISTGRFTESDVEDTARFGTCWPSYGKATVIPKLLGITIWMVTDNGD